MIPIIGLFPDSGIGGRKVKSVDVGFEFRVPIEEDHSGAKRPLPSRTAFRVFESFARFGARLDTKCAQLTRDVLLPL
jgi:hypothetical protein